MKKGVTLLASMLLLSSCVGRGRGFLLPAVLGTAIVTAAIVSANPPPPPRVIYVPEPRTGFTWQPGYWTIEGNAWVWVEGRWVSLHPGYYWSPTHWVGDPDGTWRLIPGQWIPVGPPSYQPGSPPGR